MEKILLNTKNTVNDTTNTTLLILLIIGIIVAILLSIASLYLISSLRRKNIVWKKVDYLIEDITYKSESLNVTVETLNKISNYALALDSVSQKGFKSMIKLVSENRNYIYKIIEKLRNDVEKKENKSKKSTTTKSKKPTTKKILNKNQENVKKK